jgi:hypothetical protein
MAILYKLLCVLVIVFILVSCSSPYKVTKENFVVIASGMNSGYNRKQQIVIKDEATFKEVWTKIYSIGSDEPLPKIDFTKNTAIAVFYGDFQDSGASIEVKSVDLNGSAIVTVNEIRAGVNCVTLPVTTQAFQIVTIPRTNLYIKFDVISLTVNC